MPKSKIRNRHKTNHYNEYSGLVLGKRRQLLYGKRARPVPGSDWRIKKKSGFMGSMVTPENRHQYEENQAASFIEKYNFDQDKEKQKIEENDKLAEEQKEEKLKELEKSRVSGRALEMLAQRFGRYQRIKEQKHYKAWLRGEEYYSYKGSTFPVLTEKFLKDSKSIKDIVNIGEDG